MAGGKSYQTRSAGLGTNTQGDLAAKMEELEEKFQKGLENLRADYQRERSDDGSGVGDPFETRLRNFESEILRSIGSIKAEIREIKEEVESSKKREENRLRLDNFNKILIRGIPEGDNADLIGVVCDIINKRIKVNISKNEISCCYRLGKVNNLQHSGKQKCRPVVVDFACKWKRDEIFFSKRNLKGSNLLVSEVLTRSCFDLLLKVKKLFDRSGNCVWTVKGIIVVKIGDSKVFVRNEEDLNKLPRNVNK